MKQYLQFILLILILTGCKSEFDSFNEQALTFANNDKRIDEQEYQKLVNQISGSDEKGFQQFKNDKGEIDNAKAVSYLLKYFKAKNVALTTNDIWQPETNVTQETFNINVYLENSASMDGYVKGVTEFETAIYNLLGDFKISGLCDSLNLNYINKTIPYQKQNALPADIQDFIEKLEPSVFKQRGGDRSVSDLKNILNTVLKTVDNKNAAVLISDFVFSPGKQADAQDLDNQGVGIRFDFREKLKEFDLSAIIIQLQSNFDGLYYDKTDKPVSFKGKRPYYVWIFGSTEQISSILNKKILDNIKGRYSNRLVLQSVKGISELHYKILYSPKIGSFSAKQLNNKVISEAEASANNQNKGLFGFNIAVDFSNSLQDTNYFLDSVNYVLSNAKYQLQVETISDKNDASLSGFTHLFKLQTGELKEEVLKIDIVGKVPSWVFNSTSIDDSNILNDNSEQQKTFGLKYLIEGVSGAFYQKSANVIDSIPVKITTAKSTFSWIWIIIVLIIATIIFLIVKRKNNN